MNRRRLDAATLLILCCAPVSSFGETPPPRAPFDAITWKATEVEKPSTGVKLGAVHVQFEKTTLDDIWRAATIGSIAHQGDAGESVYWLCYTNVTPTKTERIWIIADGEMGGPEHQVTSISATLLSNQRATPDCPNLPERMKPLSLDSGLWLSAPVTDLRDSLGPPSYQKGPWHSYNYEGKVPGKCEGEGFDVINWLVFRLEKGRVKALHAGQVTSC